MTSSIKNSIGMVQAAAKAGKLSTYKLGQSIGRSDGDVQQSWGPAMRR